MAAAADGDRIAERVDAVSPRICVETNMINPRLRIYVCRVLAKAIGAIAEIPIHIERRAGIARGKEQSIAMIV